MLLLVDFGGSSEALTTSSFALTPIATALRGRSLYEIERWLRIVTPDSMSIGAAL